MKFGYIKRASGLRLALDTGAWDYWGPPKNNPKTHMRTHLTKRAKKIPVTLVTIPESDTSRSDISIVDSVNTSNHEWYLDEVEELIFGANK